MRKKLRSWIPQLHIIQKVSSSREILPWAGGQGRWDRTAQPQSHHRISQPGADVLDCPEKRDGQPCWCVSWNNQWASWGWSPAGHISACFVQVSDTTDPQRHKYIMKMKNKLPAVWFFLYKFYLDKFMKKNVTCSTIHSLQVLWTGSCVCSAFISHVKDDLELTSLVLGLCVQPAAAHYHWQMVTLTQITSPALGHSPMVPERVTNTPLLLQYPFPRGRALRPRQSPGKAEVGSVVSSAPCVLQPNQAPLLPGSTE